MKLPLFVAASALSAIPLCAQPAVIGAGYSAPYPIKVAPGQLVTIFVNGIGATLTSRVSATSLPLPYTLAGISVTIDELMNPSSVKRVPILAVAPEPIGTFTGPPRNATAVSVQIPYDLRTTSFISPLTPPLATLTVHENGAPAVAIRIAPTVDQIHIATTCDANLTIPVPGAPCRPLIAHADGSLVTPDRPAHPDELIVLYAFGLGGPVSGINAGEASPMRPQSIGSRFRLLLEPAYPYWPGERRFGEPAFAGLTPSFAGLYQINFFAPEPPTSFAPGDCSTFDSPNGNISIKVRGEMSADTASFCVFPKSESSREVMRTAPNRE